MSKHATVIALAFKDAPPATVDAGGAFSFSIVPAWPKGLGPEGASYVLRKGEHRLQGGALPESDKDDGSIALTLRAPDETGEHRLTFVVTSAKQDGHEPAEGTLPFALTAVPHETSLALWDVPSPVVRNTRFEIKAGAKCSASCGLAGKVIEIRDERDTLMGSGALGATTAPGTAALVFTAIALKAPRRLGLHHWTASFTPSELKLPHSGTTSRFSFVAVAEPAHSVSVKVVHKETKAPIAGAQVRIGVYRAQTDDTGSARVRVPKGAFPLIVTRVGYKMPERNIEVAKDIRVRIAAEKLPPEDPFALWTA